MKLNTTSRFLSFELTSEETQMALAVSPLFTAYLQNKIEAYATASLNQQLPYDPDPQRQVKAIVESERLKNFVAAYEELLSEILANQPDPQPTLEN